MKKVMKDKPNAELSQLAAELMEKDFESIPAEGCDIYLYPDQNSGYTYIKMPTILFELSPESLELFNMALIKIEHDL